MGARFLSLSLSPTLRSPPRRHGAPAPKKHTHLYARAIRALTFELFFKFFFFYLVLGTPADVRGAPEWTSRILCKCRLHRDGDNEQIQEPGAWYGRIVRLSSLFSLFPFWISRLDILSHTVPCQRHSSTTHARHPREESRHALSRERAFQVCT